MSDTIWSAIVNFFARIISAVIALFKRDNTKQNGNRLNQIVIGNGKNETIIKSDSAASNDVNQVVVGSGENKYDTK